MDSLNLDRQICFPLYAASKEIVKRYRPFLDEVDLTYTQYLVMLVVWENSNLSVNEIGRRLYLDSGTLTPVIKKLEGKGLITRTRSSLDERRVVVEVSDTGLLLKQQCSSIPEKIRGCVDLNDKDLITLRKLLYNILEKE